MFWKLASVSRVPVPDSTLMVVFALLASAFIVAEAGTASACGRRSGGCCPSYCFSPGGSCLPSGSPAQILVRVPKGARVYFDNEPTTQGGEIRLYESPPLSVGSEFWYKVRAEINSGHEVQTETKRVAVVAGQMTQVDFGDLSSASASAEVDPELGSPPTKATPVKSLPPIPPTGP